jgi:hypothetical protein
MDQCDRRETQPPRDTREAWRTPQLHKLNAASAELAPGNSIEVVPAFS